MDLSTVHRNRVEAVQQAIREQPGLDGWYFYDFRHSDPLAYGVLLLDAGLHVTRRWYYWIPANGTPVKLVHSIEPHVLSPLPGEERRYRGRHIGRFGAAVRGGMGRPAIEVASCRSRSTPQNRG